MKYTKKILIALLLFLIALSFCGCSSSTSAKCSNGYFQGYPEYQTGVLSFKGIPYAKSPINELRWKAPQSPDKSKAIVLADKFGKSSIQEESFTETITTDLSEDCLTLNIWTKDLKNENRPVMVYFHGGQFSHGGTSEDIYNGQYIVNTHPDVVVVTVNYRLGIMGFVDFSNVTGGDEYSDSKELGLLDCIASLDWIKNNISAFGGDADNVTIFGDASGGTIVSCLLASDYAGELFQRAICQSGSMKNTYTDDDFKASRVTSSLLKLSGTRSMNALIELSTDNLIEINKATVDTKGNTLNDIANYPLRGGSVVKEDYYSAIENASARGVDLLIGTNANEVNYYITLTADEPISELSDNEILNCFTEFENYYVANLYNEMLISASDDNKESISLFYEMLGEDEDVWTKAQFLTEAVYRQPAIRMAEYHSRGDLGRTYMYYFEKENDYFPFLGACQTCEVPYVFHNLSAAEQYGTVDSALADYICEAWVNFARSGDPSTQNVHWSEYDTVNRSTMIIGNDLSVKEKADPDKEVRELLSWTADY